MLNGPGHPSLISIRNTTLSDTCGRQRSHSHLWLSPAKELIPHPTPYSQQSRRSFWCFPPSSIQQPSLITAVATGGPNVPMSPCLASHVRQHDASHRGAAHPPKHRAATPSFSLPSHRNNPLSLDSSFGTDHSRTQAPCTSLTPSTFCDPPSSQFLWCSIHSCCTLSRPL